MIYMSITLTFVYTKAMPKLTGEELAKLYPRAKTYDELRMGQKQLHELRRPKYIALRTATWTALCIPTTTLTYSLLTKVGLGILSGSTVATLSSVCLSLLLLGFAIAFIYYMWWLIDGVTSKVLITTTLLHASLGGVLVGALALYFYAIRHGHSSLLATAATALVVFVVAFGITTFMLKKQPYSQ